MHLLLLYESSHESDNLLMQWVSSMQHGECA